MFFFQAEDGIRDLVRSRGLGDVYKRQDLNTGAGGGLGSVKQVGAGCLVDKFFATVVADLCLSLIHI